MKDRTATVLEGGVGGYHTCRIPAAVNDDAGRLYLFCEGRVASSSDFDATHLLLLKSEDNGESWSAPQLIWNEGKTEDKITIGNPCPVYDSETDTLLLLFTRNNEGVFFTKSEDRGETWAEPREISEAVTPRHFKRYWTGPGHGIRLRFGDRRGRLLFPSYHIQSNPGGRDSLNSHMIYSDDHGRSWAIGGGTTTPDDFDPDKLVFTAKWWPDGFLWAGCECIAAELPDGSLYLTVRNQVHYRESRAYSWSTDGGETWAPLGLHPEIRDPKCQGAVLVLADGYPDGTPDPSGAVEHCPALYTGITRGIKPQGEERARLALFTSTDGCRSWRESRVLHEGPAGYSDLVAAPDGTVCCLFECGGESYHSRIAIAHIDCDTLCGKASVDT